MANLTIDAPAPVGTLPELEVIGMTKRFGSLVALDDVSMHVRAGTFHALLGENGAGKSTLVKCIIGFYKPDNGKVLLGKRALSIDNPRDAHKHGIGMVYQHFTSVPAMTVAENLVLCDGSSASVINWQQEFERLQAFMDASPFRVPLDVPVAELAAGQKQKLEILKQLYLKSRILILDEPTSVLTPREADEVLGLLRESVLGNNLSVVMITHKFREVEAYTDEVTVLRKGKLAGCGLVKDLGIPDLAEMMMGEKREPDRLEKVAGERDEVVLQVEDLSASKDNGLPAVKGVSFTVRSGEIVGIAGVSGNGQKELVEVLAGQRPATAGQCSIDGSPYRATRQEMAARNVFVLPEEPLRNACVPHMSVAENMALRTFDRPPQAKWNFLLVLRAIRQAARGLIETFSVKTPTPDTAIDNLSGGNIQRAVLARELSSERINLLIAANPCFGLDFNAVDFIHRAIVEARNRGVAVLMVSEDLDELLKLADRISVMSDGEIVYTSPVAEADIATIGQRMAGH